MKQPFQSNRLYSILCHGTLDMEEVCQNCQRYYLTTLDALVTFVAWLFTRRIQILKVNYSFQTIPVC